MRPTQWRIVGESGADVGGIVAGNGFLLIEHYPWIHHLRGAPLYAKAHESVS